MLFSPYVFNVYNLIPTNVHFIMSYLIHAYVNKQSTCSELYQFIIRTLYLFFYYSTALYGPGPPRSVEASRSHTLDTPQSVGLLWTRDQPVAETST
jgi:hypothetical protein